MEFTHPVKKHFTFQPFQILIGMLLLDDYKEIRLGAGNRYSLLLGKLAELERGQLGDVLRNRLAVLRLLALQVFLKFLPFSQVLL